MSICANNHVYVFTYKLKCKYRYVYLYTYIFTLYIYIYIYIYVYICYPPQRSTNVCFGCLQDALWARVSRIWACFVYVNIRHVLFVWALDMFCFYVSIGYVLFLFSWWSVSRTIFHRVRCSRYQQLDKNILHVSRQRLSGAGPQVSVAMPLLILCRPDLGTKKGAAHFRELVQTQAILDEPPSSINDLCACLHTQLFATWQFVGHQLHKIRWFPHEFASHFHALLLVNHTVVQDTAHFGFVRTCTVSMENHLRSLSNRSASGFQSTLRIAPGPGARVVVGGGFNLARPMILDDHVRRAQPTAPSAQESHSWACRT